MEMSLTALNSDFDGPPRQSCDNPMMQPYRIPYIVSTLLILAATAGCGKTTVVNNGPEGLFNLRSIARAYAISAMRSRPPASIEDLMPVLKEIGDPHELLRSPRDGKPYAIVWGIDAAHPKATPKTAGFMLPIVAYEQDGKEGKRQVIDLTMRVSECTPDEFAQLKLPSPRTAAN